MTSPQTTRRAVMAGLAAAPVAGLPAIARAVTGDDPIFVAFAEYERANTAKEAISKAADDLRGETYAAIEAAGLERKEVFTRRQLEDWHELGICSDRDYEAGLAKLEGPPSEYQKMLMRVEESDDEDMEACRAAGDAERALCETAPTTREGASRLLRHLADFLSDDDVVNDHYLDDVVGDAIRNAVAVLEREALS
ncbi:hypothetical protein [Methylocystis sp.]|uniref:hypothetical protein n=1 Tax=Methylocystis sp. TaxID=1911079 RepID=UPI003D0D641E